MYGRCKYYSLEVLKIRDLPLGLGFQELGLRIERNMFGTEENHMEHQQNDLQTAIIRGV